MKTETLNAVLATCAVTATIAACTFVAIKSRNDGSIARDTGRVADAAERISPPRTRHLQNLERCGKVLPVQGLVNGLTMSPSAFLAVEEEGTKRTFQLKLSGVWKEGMTACGTPL